MNEIEKKLFEEVSGLHDIPQVGVFNIRENGKLLARGVDDEINIVSKKDKEGIDIFVKENTKNKSVHIPVIVSQEGINDKVYNDFFIGNNCDILIVAGCGIHNAGQKQSSHNGIHTFHIGDNCKVKYVEKHFAFGDKKVKKVLDPITSIEIGKNSFVEMETVQLGGVSKSDRRTKAYVGDNSTLIIKEKILTQDKEIAKTNFVVELNGENSKVDVLSRSVAGNKSKQEFISNIIGRKTCFGHVECDGILSENAVICSVPKIVAFSPEANLVHEAAIGKISQEQQQKLMSMGLTKDEAEKVIIKGFLN